MGKYLYKNKLYFLKDVLYYLKNHELTDDLIEKIGYELLSNNGILVNTKFESFSNDLSYYNQNKNLINCNSQSIEKNVIENIKNKNMYYNLYDISTLEQYFKLYIILHECAHAYQFNNVDLIIGNDDDKEFLRRIYKYYTKFLINTNSYDNASRRLYVDREHDYFIERGADIEAYKVLFELGKLDNDELMASYFEMFLLSTKYKGYQDNRYGSIYETFKNTNQENAFKKLYEKNCINVNERIKYGLILNDNQYKNYINYINDIENMNSKIIK